MVIEGLFVDDFEAIVCGASMRIYGYETNMEMILLFGMGALPWVFEDAEDTSALCLY